MAKKPVKKKTLGKKSMKTTKGGGFQPTFQGGVFVAAGDVDGGGIQLTDGTSSPRARD